MNRRQNVLNISNELTFTDVKLMTKYIINRNAQPTGEHEVHKDDGSCSNMPNPSNRINLGNFAGCHDAIAEARRLYPGKTIDGCYYCANACHTR